MNINSQTNEKKIQRTNKFSTYNGPVINVDEESPIRTNFASTNKNMLGLAKVTKIGVASEKQQVAPKTAPNNTNLKVDTSKDTYNKYDIYGSDNKYEQKNEVKLSEEDGLIWRDSSCITDQYDNSSS